MMGAKARRRWPFVAACCVAALAGCGQSPSDSLSARDRERWAPRAPDRSAVPVLVYRGVGPGAFGRQMALLHHAGYDTITLDEFVRFVQHEHVGLPARPLLLTLDGGLRDAWTESDAALRDNGFNAVLFVDVGRVEDEDPDVLGWDELGDAQRSDRWDVQLQSGTGGRQRIRYGSAPDAVGPFYAYRGSDEVLGGWRERVFSDVTYGEEQLAFHVPGYRPLAFAPPYGNYGQAGTNDRRIPSELLARLRDSFDVVFVQDRSGLAAPGAANPLGRFEITPAVTEDDLHALLAPAT